MSDAAGLLEAAGGLRAESRDLPRPDAAHAAAQFCNAPAGGWGGPAQRAGNAGTLRYLDDADLYARDAVETSANHRRTPSQELSGRKPIIAEFTTICSLETGAADRRTADPSCPGMGRHRETIMT